MNTLFITHHYLSSNGGGSFASRAFINAFAELSDSMALLYPIKDGENLFDGINPKVEALPVSYDISSFRKLAHLLCGKVHRYYKVARTLSEQRHFDSVVFDTSVVSFGLIDLFKRKGSRVIVIHHNYQYEYFRDNTRLVLKLPTLFWCKRYEGEAVRKANLNLTLTSQDIKLLADNYNNGDTSNFRLLGIFEHKPSVPVNLNGLNDVGHRFVITGNLGAKQTKDSLIPWIRDYYPVLKDMFSDATLTIAGKNPGTELIKLCKDNDIRLIPSPESMEPIMRDANFYICPISFGGGIKLRVMDGLKWGLPVIAHGVSARGYEEFEEKGFLLSYLDKRSFQESLKKLKSCTYNRQMARSLYLNEMPFSVGVRRLSYILS